MSPATPSPGGVGDDPNEIDAAFNELVGGLDDLAALEIDPEQPLGPPEEAGGEEPVPLAHRFARRGWAPQQRDLNTDANWNDEGHFVPPTPPPFEAPRGNRLYAWIGVIGAPVVMILLAVTSTSPPAWLTLICTVGFVGGIAYLIATMSHDHDGWDDGAVL